MKRDIKFRAWNKVSKIYLYNVQDTYDTLGGFMKYDDSEDTHYDECYFGDFLNNKRYDVEQFTGLTDVNGREIYESDILKVTGEDGESYIATVKWFGDEDYPAFDLEGIPAAWNYDANALATIFQSGIETCEVIGNVHMDGDLIDS